MEPEELILKIQEYLNSPYFMSLTEEQKDNFIKFGISMAISVQIGVKVLESVTQTLELDRLTKQLDLSKLELLWRGKNGK